MKESKGYTHKSLGWIGGLLCLLLFSCQGRQNTPIPDHTLLLDPLPTLELLAEQASTPSVRYQKARYLLALNRINQAIEELSLAIAEDNTQPKFYALRAFAYYKGNQFASARQDALKARLLQYQEPTLLVLLAELEIQQKRYREATKRLEEVVQIAPLMAIAWYWKGHVAMSVEDTLQAIPYFRRSLQLDSNLSASYVALAFLHNRLGEPAIAQQYLSIGLKRDTSNGNLYYQLAENLMTVGRPDSARMYYLKAVRKHPALKRAYYQSGKIDFQAGHYPEALLNFEQLPLQQDSLPMLDLMMGTCYEYGNQLQQALIAYSRAAEKDTGNYKLKERIWQLKKILSDAVAIPQ